MDDSHHRWVIDRAERAWLVGHSTWWPDTIPLLGSKPCDIAGDPSSRMPPLAQERINDLIGLGLDHVKFLAPGVHAYNIGLVLDYTVFDE